MFYMLKDSTFYEKWTRLPHKTQHYRGFSFEQFFMYFNINLTIGLQVCPTGRTLHAKCASFLLLLF